MNPQEELSFFFSPRERGGGKMKRVLKLIFMAIDSLHCKNIKEKKTVARRPNK